MVTVVVNTRPGVFAPIESGAAEVYAAIVDVASASTCDIGETGSMRVRVTGTTTITSFGTSANKLRTVVFAGVLTLTHAATSLILPTGANITTAAGDTAWFQSDGNGNWRCISYQRADGTPLAGAGSVDTAANYTWTGNHSFGRQFSITSDLSPTQITSDQNDYSPTSLDTAAALRLDSNANRSITGLAGGADGRVIVVRNIGSYVIRLKNENSSSTAANRFSFGADLFVAPKKSVMLMYDATLSRWVAASRYSEPYGIFKAWRNGVNQTGLTAGAFNLIALNTEVIDSDSLFDSSTNYRYQPQIEGYYHIQATAAAAANSESPVVQIHKNGSGVGTGGDYIAAGAGSGNYISTHADIVYLNGTTDYVDARMYLPSGVTQLSGQSYMFGSLWKAA